MRSHARGASRLAVGLSTLVASVAVGGCASSSAEPTVFGGEGAQVLNEKPLPPGAGDPNALGPCGKVSPPTDMALLDDFEDGDGHLFKGFERDGYWYSAGDNTQGSTITPMGTFAATLLPEGESTKENRFAAHLTASGQTDWGVVWGSAVQWVQKGIKCPANVSGFAGLRFRAKGPGQVRVSVAVPEVIPKDGGGTCTDKCYDAHGRLILLSNAWDTYEVRWEKIAQRGFATEARFTPERIVNIGFNVDVKNLPIDLWIDDVELIAKTTAVAAP